MTALSTRPPKTRSRVSRSGPLVGLIGALAAACGGDGTAQGGDGEAQPAPPAWPPGTAVAVDDVPISVAEIDAMADWMGTIETEASRTKRRRDALTARFLPLAAGRVHNAEERERTLEQARQRLAFELGQGTLDLVGPPGPPQVLEGDLSSLGYPLWWPASELEVGQWRSEPFEDIGRFLLIELRTREPGPQPIEDVLTVAVHAFPYFPAATTGEDIDGWIDSCELQIVDPAFDEVVPSAWKYRMRGPQ